MARFDRHGMETICRRINGTLLVQVLPCNRENLIGNHHGMTKGVELQMVAGCRKIDKEESGGRDTHQNLSQTVVGPLALFRLRIRMQLNGVSIISEIFQDTTPHWILVGFSEFPIKILSRNKFTQLLMYPSQVVSLNEVPQVTTCCQTCCRLH